MGAVLVLVSAVCFGAMAIFAKYAYAAGVSLETVLLLRFTIAAALMGTVLGLRPHLRDHTRVPLPTAPRSRARRRVLVTAVALGAIGYAAQSTFYFSALTRIDASLTALVFYAYPVMVTLGAVALGWDRLSVRRWGAVATAVAGTVLLLAGVGGLRFDPTGVALAFGAAVVYTAYILVSGRIVHSIPPVVLSALVMAGAATTFGIRALLSGGVSLDFPANGWIWVVCIAVVSTVCAILTFFAGLARTGASAASILSTFEPVVTTSLAAWTLGEFLTPRQLLGGLLVLGAVAVLQVRDRRATGPRSLAGDNDAAVARYGE